MRLDEVKAGLIEVDEEVEEEDAGYSDEDFWEAIDLLETSRKSMLVVLKYAEITAGRRTLMNNLCDDIKQFLDFFVEVKE